MNVLSIHLLLQVGAINQSVACLHAIHMCLRVFMLQSTRWVNTHTLCGYMYVDMRRRGKVQGSVARATAWELLLVVIHVMCSLMRKLTVGKEEGHGGRGAGEMGDLTVQASWYPPADLCLFWKDPWSPTVPEASAPGGSSVSTFLHLH